MTQRSLSVAVLISGGGTTLRNLMDRQETGQLPIDFKLVISSTATALGIAFAEKAGIPVKLISRKDYAEPADHSKAVFDLCRDADVGIVVMGGYLEHLLIPEDFRNRVINIHPSLIPAFSGRGFYGMHVHESVLSYGAKISGCTVHFVDDEFDHGPIIAQRACPVKPEDTPEALQSRVFQEECQLLPEVLTALAENRVVIDGRQVTTKPQSQ